MDENATPDRQLSVKPRRRWYQFTVRTLLIFVTLVGCGLGWLGIQVQHARQHQAAVDAIRQSGGLVEYNHLSPPAPAFLRALLGDDVLREPFAVQFSGGLGKPITDADLVPLDQFTKLPEVFFKNTRVTGAGFRHLAGLKNLDMLYVQDSPVTDEGLTHLKDMVQLQVLALNGTKVTDAGLENLNRLTGLRALLLKNTSITDAGIAKLQKALPNCKIGK